MLSHTNSQINSKKLYLIHTMNPEKIHSLSPEEIKKQKEERRGAAFLGNTYPLTKESTAVQSETGNQHEKINRFLERLDNIASHEKGTGLRLLIDKYLKNTLLDIEDEQKLEQMAIKLYESEKQQAINEGHGASIPDELTDEMLESYKEEIRKKYEYQRESLKNIISYVAKNEDGHPNWFRYFILRSIAKMGVLDTENTTYTNRSNTTVAPFLHLNHEAIGFVRNMLEAELEKEELILSETELEEIQKTAKEAFEKLPADIQKKTSYEAVYKKEKQKRLKEKKANFQNKTIAKHQLNELTEEQRKILDQKLASRSFADLYAFAQIEVHKDIETVTTEGVWRTFPKDSDPSILEDTLKNKGTGWCTATGSAPGHLKGGDFYAYYTYTPEEYAQKEKGEEVTPSQPVIAIRMRNGKVYEVRGTEPDQNISPEFVDIAAQMYQSLPGGDKFEKKRDDMQHLTNIYTKYKQDENGDIIPNQDISLSKEDLAFLYEIHSLIEGFGYKQDPRIEQLYQVRNRKQDLIKLFADNDPQKVAHAPEDITDNTTIFIGDLSITKETKLKNIQWIEGGVTLSDGLNAEVAKRLIEIGRGGAVVNNLEKFEGLDHKEIALRLIEAGKGWAVAYNLEKFEGLDAEVAKRLIEPGDGWAVADNLEKFEGLDHKEIALRLIEADDGEAVAYNLEKFEGLSTEMKQEIQEKYGK